MAFAVTDTLVAGQQSPQALAVLSVAAAIFMSVFVSLMGVLQALLPIWSSLHGAGRGEDLGRSVRQSLYLVLCLLVMGWATLLQPETILEWSQVPQDLHAEAKNYLAVLAWALPTGMLFRLFSTLNQSLGKPRLVTVVQLVALAAKVPTTVLLTQGWGTWPGLGVEGCAWATALVYLGMSVFAGGILWRATLYQPLALWRWPERPDVKHLLSMARLGLPSGLVVMIEVTSFTLMALLIARQGHLSLAAHQIVGNLAALLYMVPLSLAIATSTRVSYGLGAQTPAQARQALLAGCQLTALTALVLSAVVWLGRQPIAVLYSNDAKVQASVLPLLTWLALYHLADATQVLCSFVLRCFRVTWLPMLGYGVLLWGVGLGGGHLLAQGDLFPGLWTGSPLAYWASSTLALALTAVLLVASLGFHVSRHLTAQTVGWKNNAET